MNAWGAALLALGVGLSVEAAQQPNVVILFSDDAGYADFGFQPNVVDEMRHRTPHIDSIARDGVRFTDAYVSGAVCSPSRAGLMTGRYQQRFGYDNNLPPGTKDGLDLKETFGSKRMQELGYKTGLVGKWHLGYPDAFHPNKRGWDWFYGLLQGSRGYHPSPTVSAHRVIQENGKATKEEGYVTDRFGDAACRFIRANKSAPFYLFVSFTTPHAPNQPKKSDLPRVADIEGKQRKAHCGLLISLDDNVGKILACLQDEGLAENTLVIFTNDNGGATHTGAKNTPLLGKKGNLTEGGIRVPMVMRWPGTIPKGSVVEDPVITLDFLPTMVEMAGHAVDAEWKLDGRSLLPLLKGESKALAERPLFWRKAGSGGARAMRKGPWKVVHDRREKEAPKLFNLADDISESTDLANKGEAHKKRLAGMLAEMDAWESEMEEPRWGAGKK